MMLIPLWAAQIPMYIQYIQVYQAKRFHQPPALFLLWIMFYFASTGLICLYHDECGFVVLLTVAMAVMGLGWVVVFASKPSDWDLGWLLLEFVTRLQLCKVPLC